MIQGFGRLRYVTWTEVTTILGGNPESGRMQASGNNTALQHRVTKAPIRSRQIHKVRVRVRACVRKCVYGRGGDGGMSLFISLPARVE